jgi:hypothetical protein
MKKKPKVTRKRLRVWEVRPNGAGSGWLLIAGDTHLQWYPTKAKAVREGMKLAREMPFDVSLRIRRKDGTYQDETTSDRKADPRRSRG